MGSFDITCDESSCFTRVSQLGFLRTCAFAQDGNEFDFRKAVVSCSCVDSEKYSQNIFEERENFNPYVKFRHSLPFFVFLWRFHEGGRIMIFQNVNGTLALVTLKGLLLHSFFTVNWKNVINSFSSDADVAVCWYHCRDYGCSIVNTNTCTTSNSQVKIY